MTRGTVMRSGELRGNFVSDTDGCIACQRRLCDFIKDGRTGVASGCQHGKRPVGMVLRRGERLESSEQDCLRFWVVVDGTAAICTSFADGRRQIIGLESAGDIICGLMASDEGATWLEALEETVICELDFSSHAAELQHDATFIAMVFGITHQRLETASRHLATLGRLDSTERVILFLGDMARRQRNAAVPGRSATLPMSREDIADYLGLNTETVSRIFSRLKKSGLIKFLSPTEYVIPDFAALECRLPVPVPTRRENPFDGFPGAPDLAPGETA